MRPRRRALRKSRMDIRACSALREVLSEVDEDTVVFLDVDETLLRASSHAGSEGWEKALTAELKALGVSPDMAWRSSCYAWQAMQRVIPTQACEGETAAVVAELQRKAAAVYGLTARHPALATTTLEALAAAGIVLAPSSEAWDESGLPAHVPATIEARADAGWAEWFEPALASHGGVWFCCGPRKLGAAQAALARLASGGGRAARKAVLVDDRRAHLEQVAEGLATRGLPFVGFHFALEGAGQAAPGLDETSRMLARLLVSADARADLGVAMRIAEADAAGRM